MRLKFSAWEFISFLYYCVFLSIGILACGDSIAIEGTDNVDHGYCWDRRPPEQWESVSYEGNPYPTPPDGFDSAIGHAHALLGPSEFGGSGSVTIDDIELYEITPDGQTSLIASGITCERCNDNEKVWGYTIPKSDWRCPECWDLPPSGQSFEITPEGYVKVPVDRDPSMLWHWWQTTDPRTRIKPDHRYYVKARVMIAGNAMFQCGIDYWDESVSPNEHIEAARSNWICDQTPVDDNGWITVYAGAYPHYVPMAYVNQTGACGGKTPCYSSIQTAIDASDTGSVILIVRGIYTESITLNQSKTLALQGGWDSTFATQTSNVTIIKAPKAMQGSLALQLVTIKP